MMRRLVFAALALYLWPAAGFADDNASANKIFVETYQVLTAVKDGMLSEEMPLVEQRELLVEINDNLQRIIDDYPGSDIAVKIITGAIEGMDQETVQERIRQIDRELDIENCWDAPTLYCVNLLTERAIGDGKTGPVAASNMLIQLAEIYRDMDDPFMSAESLYMAMDTAKSIDNPLDRYEIKGKIAGGFVYLDDASMREQVVAEAEPDEQSGVLLGIAIAQIDLGQNAQANETLQRAAQSLEAIENQTTTDLLLIDIAIQLARAGHRDEARQAIERVSEDYRSEAEVDLSTARARGYREPGTQFTTGSSRIFAVELANICQTRAEVCNLDQDPAGLDDIGLSAFAQMYRASIAFDTGDNKSGFEGIQEALKYAERLEQYQARALFYSRAAALSYMFEDYDLSRRYYEKATSLIKLSPDSGTFTDLSYFMAYHLAFAGDFTSAMKIAENVPAHVKPWTLLVIFREMVRQQG